MSLPTTITKIFEGTEKSCVCGYATERVDTTSLEKVILEYENVEAIFDKYTFSDSTNFATKEFTRICISKSSLGETPDNIETNLKKLGAHLKSLGYIVIFNSGYNGKINQFVIL